MRLFLNGVSFLIGGLALIFADVPLIQAAGTCDGRPCIAIGSFNIKMLGAGGREDLDRDVDKLVDRIVALDIVALQEINKTSTAWANLLAKLQSRGFSVIAEGGFGGANPGRQQFVMILADTDQISVAPGTALDLPIETTNPALWEGCVYDSLRPPLSVSVRAGEFDFRLIGVHLKSQSPVKLSGSNICDDDLRQWQATRMIEELEQLRVADGEDDVVIVGDFNSPLSAEEFYPLRRAGYYSLIPEKCRRKPSQQGCTHLVRANSRYGPNVLDHVAVRRGMQERVARSGEIGKLGVTVSSYRQHQSDHLPVWALFYTDRDDD
jgi:endonuclease/exonuclease/phosphatase family metal-dependent hydrolase